MQNTNKITIIGFGNQARAWALNFRDSGYKVCIGLRKNSSSFTTATDLGFETFCFEEVEIPTRFFALLIPDDQHEKALVELSKLNKNKCCLYAHGYSVFKFELNQKFKDFDHVLLAPKSIASELRFLFETKGNLTGFYSLEFAKETQLAELRKLAHALGLTNFYPTKFQEETQADLFSEQSILCALLPYGILETYNTLVERGYSKELAFYECFYESKLILDTIFKVGPTAFFDLISPNALIGSEVGRELLIDESFKAKLKKLLTDIEENRFQETIQHTDVDQLRSEITQFWQKQDLHSMYSELKESL